MTSSFDIYILEVLKLGGGIMAMISCPECGKDISDKATTCPNCGLPIDDEILQLNTISNKDDNDSDTKRLEEYNRNLQNKKRLMERKAAKDEIANKKNKEIKSQLISILTIGALITLYICFRIYTGPISSEVSDSFVEAVISDNYSLAKSKYENLTFGEFSKFQVNSLENREERSGGKHINVYWYRYGKDEANTFAVTLEETFFSWKIINVKDTVNN